MGFRRAGLTVLLGSAAGLGITLAVTPFISRIFEPAIYGHFAVVTAIVSVFVGVSTLRLESLSLQVQSQRDADDILGLAIITSLTWGVILSIGGGAAVWIRGAPAWWLLVGVLVTTASMQLLGGAVYTRRASYRQLTVANFVQGAGTGLVQLILGLASPGVWSLIAGFGLPRLVWLRGLPHGLRSSAGHRATWAKSRRFAIFVGSAAAFNSVAGQLPILLTSALFGSVAVGVLAIAIRVLVGPLALIGQAASAASLGEIGGHLRAHDERALVVTRQAMRDLLILGLLPCALVAYFGGSVFSLILGEKWQHAGVLAGLLAFGALGEFAIAPFHSLLAMTLNNRLILTWDVIRTVAIFLAFVVPYIFGGTVDTAVACYSGVMVLLYGSLAFFVLRAVSHWVSSPSESSSADLG